MALPNMGKNNRGYDPYNHTGKLIRRAECWAGLRTEIMGGKVFFMDNPTFMAFDLAKPKSDKTAYYFWDPLAKKDDE